MLYVGFRTFLKHLCRLSRISCHWWNYIFMKKSLPRMRWCISKEGILRLSWDTQCWSRKGAYPDICSVWRSPQTWQQTLSPQGWCVFEQMSQVFRIPFHVHPRRTPTYINNKIFRIFLTWSEAALSRSWLIFSVLLMMMCEGERTVLIIIISVYLL